MNQPLKAGTYQDSAPEHMERTLLVLKGLDGRDGFVFCLAYIEGKRVQPREFLDLLRDHVERLGRGFGVDANPQHRFEQFLRALNEQIAQKVKSGFFEIPIEDVNALIGIACDGQMFLSGTGDLTALFLHRKPSNQYQVYNLFRSIQTEQSLPTWEKIFAVVLDGDLHAGDAFCVANRELQRFIAQDELNTVLATLPPTGAVEKIRQYFPYSSNLALVTLQMPLLSAIETPAAQPLTGVSVEHLEDTRAETERLLEDQRPRLSQLLLSLIKRKPGTSGEQNSLRRRLSAVVLSSLRVVGRMLWGIVSWFRRLSGKMIRKESRSHAVADTKQRADEWIRSILGRFNGLPKTSRYLVVAAVGVVALLAVSVTAVQHNRTVSQDEESYQAQVAAIRDKKDQGDAAIIYHDENRARSLYTEALSLIDALATDTAERTQNATQLRASIATAFDQLRHVVNFPDPPIIADLSSVSPTLTGRALVRVNSFLAVFGSDKALYRIDTTTKSATKVETTDGEVGVAMQASVDDDVAYFLDDRPGVSKFDATNMSLQITGVAPGDNMRWTDLVTYNGKLYVLSPGGGGTDSQIIKFNPTSSGFDGGTNWIRAKSTDLSDAVSLAIDATIFVLKQDGKIVRFVSGSEVGWDAQAVDPAVTQASEIKTDTESKFVYVLEPATQRLIVYNKDSGAFVVQYRSDAWSGLRDFLVDEQTKTVYLLAGAKVYSIQASHL